MIDKELKNYILEYKQALNKLNKTHNRINKLKLLMEREKKKIETLNNDVNAVKNLLLDKIEFLDIN